MEYKEFKPIIIATIVMIAITLSLTMTGCVAPDGTWTFNGTVNHRDDRIVLSPTPEVVYVTQTPEVVYVTVTPEPEPEPTPTLTPEPTPTPDMAGEDIELENLIPIYNLPGIFEMIDLEIHDGLVVGTYTVEGETYHVYVGVIRYTSSVSPAIFVEEYKNKPEFENSPSQTVSRFSTVTFNGHEATEVRTVSPTGDIRYGYVWSMDRYVYFLKPGASDRSASLELARMIGIPGSASVPTSQTTPAPIHTPAVCETRPPLEVSSGGCDGLDQNVLRRYDFDNNGLIDSNEMENAKLGYESNYEKPYDYAQILYAYEHRCPVWSTVNPTPEPTVQPTPAETQTPEPMSKAHYPVAAVFDIENRDSPGDMCYFVIQLRDDGRVFMNSDCEGQTVIGRWVLEFDGTESWVYSITAYGDTMSLHLNSGGKAELYLPDATEYGQWEN